MIFYSQKLVDKIPADLVSPSEIPICTDFFRQELVVGDQVFVASKNETRVKSYLAEIKRIDFRRIYGIYHHFWNSDSEENQDPANLQEIFEKFESQSEWIIARGTQYSFGGYVSEFNIGVKKLNVFEREYGSSTSFSISGDYLNGNLGENRLVKAPFRIEI